MIPMDARSPKVWEVHRPLLDDDGLGGQTETLALVRTERGDVRELTGRELIEAQQAGAEHSHSGWFRARADIRRRDELRRGVQRLEVLTVSPTFPTQDRLRVTARSIETAGGDL